MSGNSLIETNDLEQTCLSCGGVATPGAKYCAYDGIELNDQSPLVTIDQLRRCSSCSKIYPLRARFCAQDGSKLPEPKRVGSAPKAESAELVEKQPATIADKPLTKDSSSEAGLIGTTLDGKYQIQSLIAEGGMAMLYRALQIAMERTVAIKVMKPNAAMTAVRLKRFEQECKLAARLNHPNIVSVYDVGWVSEQEPFLVMEFIDGNPLANDISEKGPPPPKVAGQILIQILRGLEEAHAAGIIHRDLKPDNILLQKKSDRADWVKIVDFGIANFNNSSKRITQHGAIIGTPVYMAPEQFKDGPIDHRADVYAMGILMFETLTGDVPFDGTSPQVIMLKQLMDEPADVFSLRKDIPPSFDQIIKRALAKDPDERFQSVREFREALELALSHVS
jgi:serine/threonine-protein kinase